MASRLRKSANKEVPELNITAFLNLMVVLVPFLLITAVFSQITILELNLPASSTASNENKKELNIEVVVRGNRLELADGSRVIKRMNNKEDAYDIRALSSTLQAIKINYPDKKNATILLEPDIEYDVLVKVMDAVGGAEVAEGSTTRKIELFPQISIGDAPVESAGKGKRKG